MQLDREAIEEFKRLYLQEYGVKLTDAQVIDYGTSLIRLVKAVYGKNLPSVDNKSKRENNKNVLKNHAVFNGPIGQIRMDLRTPVGPLKLYE